jgi:hypothetical protein
LESCYFGGLGWGERQDGGENAVVMGLMVLGWVKAIKGVPLVGRNWNCKIIIFFSFCADVSFASCQPASVSLRIKSVKIEVSSILAL